MASPPTICENAEQRLHGQREQARDGEDKRDLGVAQPEVMPDQGPGSLTRSVDELVEQLDRK